MACATSCTGCCFCQPIKPTPAVAITVVVPTGKRAPAGLGALRLKAPPANDAVAPPHTYLECGDSLGCEWCQDYVSAQRRARAAKAGAP